MLEVTARRCQAYRMSYSSASPAQGTSLTLWHGSVEDPDVTVDYAELTRANYKLVASSA